MAAAAGREDGAAGPRELVAAVSRRLYERGMVSSVAGNVSLRAGDRVYITPTGAALGDLTAADVVVTDLEGRPIAGHGRPSSELAMHLAILRADPGVCAVVHTHSPLAVAFAVVGQGLEPLTTEAEMLLGQVPVVPYAPPGSVALGAAVALYVPRFRAVLLERHGVVTWGPDLRAAYHVAELVEEAARVHLLVKLLRG